MRKLQYSTSILLMQNKMYFIGLFVSLTLLLIENMSTDLKAVKPLCSKTKGHHRCCAGYRTINDKCYPCNGSFGIECSNSCPEGYFGNKCEEKCICDRCDARTGECYNGTTTINNSQTGKEASISITWISILVGLLISIGFFAVLFAVLFQKERGKILRRKSTKEEPTGREENTNHELDQDVYDSIRESRMVLDDEGACGGLRMSKTLDRDKKGMGRTMPNRYWRLSFNRCD